MLGNLLVQVEKRRHAVDDVLCRRRVVEDDLGSREALRGEASLDKVG